MKNVTCQKRGTGVKSKRSGKVFFNSGIMTSTTVRHETGNFDLQDICRGTPTSGVSESIPVEAFPCLCWDVSKSRLFHLDRA
jgi:hypothetical protein